MGAIKHAYARTAVKSFSAVSDAAAGSQTLGREDIRKRKARPLSPDTGAVFCKGGKNMNAMQAIKEALEPLNLPVVPYLYKGDAEIYITYGIDQSRGDDWGNDEPGQTVDNVEINLYTPILHNAEELTRKVRRMIARNTDFTFPRIQYSCYPEKRCKCATFTCEYME